MTLVCVPVYLREAQRFVAIHHSHNRAPRGGRFAIGASDGAQLWGVAIVGRPVARTLEDGLTAELTRVCVRAGAPKGTNSFLYARAWRAWQAMGGVRMVTYTLASEDATALKNCRWKIIGETKGNEPGKGWMNRPGREWQPVFGEAKTAWEAA